MVANLDKAFELSKKCQELQHSVEVLMKKQELAVLEKRWDDAKELEKDIYEGKLLILETLEKLDKM